MFESIILLTGPVEQNTLATVLRRHNPQLVVIPAETAADLAALEETPLHLTRLVAFATPVIVPPSLLAVLGYGAYNFHPGSPQYPGWAPAHFAVYEQATEFGVTVHEMAERVDSGAIVDVATFPLPVGIGVTELESLAYTHLAQQFWKLAPTLATDPGRCRGCRCTGATSETRAAPTGRSATSRSILQKKICFAASTPSAATISVSRRRSACTASSFARWSRLVEAQGLAPALLPGRRPSGEVHLEKSDQIHQIVGESHRP